MAENKKSVILYVDLIHTFEELTDAQAGRLIKHFFRYVNDKNPDPPDKMTKIIFEPIKQQLKRDLIKWEQERVSRSEAGKKGMASRWKSKTKITDDNSVMQPITNITDNVTVNDTVTVNVNERERAFAPPTKEEVVLVMSEKLDDFTAMGEAEKFINFYESKNWFIGKNKMKKWKAAAAGWINRMPNFKQGLNGTHKQTSGTSEARTQRNTTWGLAGKEIR